MPESSCPSLLPVISASRWPMMVSVRVSTRKIPPVSSIWIPLTILEMESRYTSAAATPRTEPSLFFSTPDAPTTYDWLSSSKYTSPRMKFWEATPSWYQLLDNASNSGPGTKDAWYSSPLVSATYSPAG